VSSLARQEAGVKGEADCSELKAKLFTILARFGDQILDVVDLWVLSRAGRC
jgi:hypothetical protein